jgi:hypothetical protein
VCQINDYIWKTVWRQCLVGNGKMIGKNSGFRDASVRTVLLTGLRSAGVIHHEAAGASEEPPWS